MLIPRCQWICEYIPYAYIEPTTYNSVDMRCNVNAIANAAGHTSEHIQNNIHPEPPLPALHESLP